MAKLELIIFTVTTHDEGCNIVTEYEGAKYLNEYNIQEEKAVEVMSKISRRIESMDYYKEYKCLFMFDR